MPAKKSGGTQPDGRDDFLAAPGLHQRGWTESLIQRFLPEPDDKRENPHYRSGPPMRRYRRERVEAIEQTAEFRAALEKTKKRQQAAARGIETKQDRMDEYLDTITIKVPMLDRDELIRRACEHYNRQQEEREREGRHASDLLATPDSADAFLKRIAVNYLRHCTAYDRELDQIAGKVGRDLAYQELSRMVFAAIAEAYPWLADECRRQRDERRSDWR
jgi:hypothetical protein